MEAKQKMNDPHPIGHSVKKSTCCTCGYSWPTGQDGSHSCAEYLRADAERYRWLREKQVRTHKEDLSRVCMFCQQTGAELDAAIDAAIATTCVTTSRD